MKMPTWTVQNGDKFHGQEIETWKSDSGEWGYGYGTQIGDHLLLETLVTGFATEADAFSAADRYCYESACESAASAVEE